LTAAVAARIAAAQGASYALHRSVIAHHLLDGSRAIKEAVCRVADVPYNPAVHGAVAAVAYELPDGTLLNVGGAERHAVPELHFDPSPLSAAYLGAPSIPAAIVSSVMACEAEVRRELMNAVVLTGGGSGFHGLQERLSRELAAAAPVGTRPRIAAAAVGERALGAWLGGSILGSLGSFHELWFSADEYAEHGAKMVHRKCP
jgi:actin-related protein